MKKLFKKSQVKFIDFAGKLSFNNIQICVHSIKNDEDNFYLIKETTDWKFLCDRIIDKKTYEKLIDQEKNELQFFQRLSGFMEWL